MYNEEVKREYLATVTKTADIELRKIFDVTSCLEEDLKVDVALLNNESLYVYFSQDERSFVSSPMFYGNLKRYLRNYRIWYNNNVTFCHIHDFDASQIDFTKLMKERVITLEDFIQVLKTKKINDVYGNYHIISLLRFCGLVTKEICYVKDSDVDLKNKTIKADRTYRINDKIAEIFKEYCSQKEVILTGLATTPKIKTEYFVKKPSSNRENKTGHISQAVSSIGAAKLKETVKDKDIAVKINNGYIRLSGMMWQMKYYTEELGYSINETLEEITSYKKESQYKREQVKIMKSMYEKYIQVYTG